MLPPCPSPPLVATAMHTFRFFEVFLGLLRVVRLLQARRHEAQAYVHTRQALTKSKLKPRTTRHESSVLIFVELEYEPFTENRRWPNGRGKLPRPLPPPTTPRP